MSMAVGASSNALSYLQQLLQGSTGAGKAASTSDPLSELLQTLSGSSASTDPLTAPPGSTDAATGSSGFPPFGSDMMNALLSLQGQSANGPSPMFAKLDADGDGQISKSEFETALGKLGVDSATADAKFAKLDANGDGSISQSELASARHGHHHHAHGDGDSKDSSAGGLQALLSGAGADGATTQTATNADGSTTTTITYADGSKIDMTMPAAASNGGQSGSGTSDDSSQSTGNKSSANLLEQLIKLQSQMLTAATSTLSAIA